MADDKTVSLRVDASEGVQGFNQFGNAAESAGDKVGGFSVETKAAEDNIKRVAVASRDYNSAARQVGESVQNITRFEKAYQAALLDTSNAGQVKVNILATAFSRTIGGAADETKAMELMRAGHVKAAEGVRYVAAHSAAMNATMVTSANAARFNAFQMQNLSYQVNDVISGLAMGQQPLQILAQQGGQVTQALGGVGATLKYLLNPYAAAAAAATVLGAAFWSSHASMKALDTALRTSNGAVGLSKSELLDLSKQMSATGAVSVSEARKIEQAIVAAGTVGGDNFRALASAAAGAGKLMGVDAADAAKTLAEAMADPAKAAETLNGRYWNLSAAQTRHIGELSRSGDLEQAQAALIEAMTAKISGAAQETSLWTRAVNGLSTAWNGLANIMSGGAIDSIADKIAKAQERIAELEKQRGDVRYAGFQARIEAEITAKNDEINALRAQLEQDKASAATAKTYGTNQAEIKTGTKISDGIVPGGDRKGLEAQQGTLTNAWQSAMGANDAEAANLKASLDAVNRALDTYVTEGERANLVTKAQAEATRLGGAEGQRYLKIESDRIANLGKVIDLGELEKRSLAVRTAANAEYAQAMVSQGKALSEAQIAATTTAQTETLNRERQALAQRKALGEITAEEELAQALEIEDRKRAVDEAAARAKLDLLKRTAGTQLTEIDAAEKAVTALVSKNATERQKQVDAIAAAQATRSKSSSLIGAEGQATTGGIATDSKSEDLRHAQAMGEITSLQEIADAERQIADERLQTQIALIDAKLAAAVHGSDEERRLLNERVAAERRTDAQIKAIDNKATESRLAKIREWTAPFKSAVNTMVSSYISGTQTMRQISRNAANYIASSYIARFAEMGMKWAEEHVFMAAINRLWALRSVATTAGAETAKTGATAAGAAARNAIGQTENSSLFSRIITMVAGWLGFETAKTGETVVGAGSRTTAEAAAAAASIISAKAMAVEMIPAYTEIAAMGAASAMAPIPYVGPALAAAAAAEMEFMGAMALAVATAAGGWDSVPYDGAPAILHKEEMVLSAKYANPLRAALTATTGGASGGLNLGALNAGAGVSMPRYGVPSFLNKGPNFANSNSTSNSTTNRGGDTHVHIDSVVAGRGVGEAELRGKGSILAKEILRELRNGNPDAKAIAGRK